MQNGLQGDSENGFLQENKNFLVMCMTTDHKVNAVMG